MSVLNIRREGEKRKNKENLCHTRVFLDFETGKILPLFR